MHDVIKVKVGVFVYQSNRRRYPCKNWIGVISSAIGYYRFSVVTRGSTSSGVVWRKGQQNSSLNGTQPRSTTSKTGNESLNFDFTCSHQSNQSITTSTHWRCKWTAKGKTRTLVKYKRTGSLCYYMPVSQPPSCIIRTRWRYFWRLNELMTCIGLRKMLVLSILFDEKLKMQKKGLWIRCFISNLHANECEP